MVQETITQEAIVWAPEISFDMKHKMLQAGIARRTQLEQVQKMFDTDSQRAEIKLSLRKAAQVMGKELDDTTLEYGVNQVLDRAYRFEEPTRNLSYKLAEKFIDRERIIKKRVIPGAIMGGVLGAVVIGANLINSAYEHDKETAVEKKVETLFAERHAMLKDVSSLEERLSSNFSGNNHIMLKAKVENAKTELDKSAGFFNNYIKGTSATDAVTIKNYGQVAIALKQAQPTLETAEAEIVAGKNIVKAQKNLDGESARLDSLIAAIRNENPTSAFMKRADTAYIAGKTSYASADLKGEQEQAAILTRISGEILEFKLLPDKTAQLCSAIKQVSKDPIADSQAADLCQSAKEHIEYADIKELRTIMTSLSDLNTQLNLAYTLKVVNRPEEKLTGVDRYYTDKSGKRISGYYILVEAINGSGQALPMDITSIENGERAKLQKWGESVPRSVFFEVSKDKKDNGILNDYSVFGVKSKGYLEPKVTMKGVDKRIGQITRWYKK